MPLDVGCLTVQASVAKCCHLESTWSRSICNLHPVHARHWILSSGWAGWLLCLEAIWWFFDLLNVFSPWPGGYVCIPFLPVMNGLDPSEQLVPFVAEGCAPYLHQETAIIAQRSLFGRLYAQLNPEEKQACTYRPPHAFSVLICPLSVTPNHSSLLKLAHLQHNLIQKHH